MNNDNQKSNQPINTDMDHESTNQTEIKQCLTENEDTCNQDSEIEEYDPEQEKLDQEFVFYVHKHMPKDIDSWDKKLRDELMEKFVEEFSEIKRQDWRDQMLIQKHIGIIQERLPSETPYPEMYQYETWIDGLDKGFIAAIEELKSDSKKSDKFERLGPYVYRVRVFSNEFCDRFLLFLDHAIKWCEENELRTSKPNSMNRYGAIMSHLGLETIFSNFMLQYMEPIANSYFPLITNPSYNYDTNNLKSSSCQVEQRHLDLQHSFIVAYKTEGTTDDKSRMMPNTANLDLHVDDAHLTISVCLGPKFEGGKLKLRGYRCPAHIHDIVFASPEDIPVLDTEKNECQKKKTSEDLSKCDAIDVDQVIGYGILHLGNLRHEAEAITSGSRANLIIWTKSSKLEKDIKEGNEKYICSVCDGTSKNMICNS